MGELIAIHCKLPWFINSFEFLYMSYESNGNNFQLIQVVMATVTAAELRTIYVYAAYTCKFYIYQEK